MKRVVMMVVAGAMVLVGPALYAQGKVEDGKKAYDAAKCATCHQIAGKGVKVGSVLDGVGAKLSAADLKKWLTSPAEMEAKLTKKPMVKMSDYMKTHKLSDADADAIVAYLQSLK